MKSIRNAMQAIITLAVLASSTGLPAQAAQFQPQQIFGPNAGKLGFSPWVSIDRVSNTFPLPLFKGKNTQAMELPGLGVLAGTSGNLLVIRTQDDVGACVRWYQAALRGSGFSVSPAAPIPGGRGYNLRASSKRWNCAIAVMTESQGSNVSLVHLTVAPKYDAHEAEASK